MLHLSKVWDIMILRMLIVLILARTPMPSLLTIKSLVLRIGDINIALMYIIKTSLIINWVLISSIGNPMPRLLTIKSLIIRIIRIGDINIVLMYIINTILIIILSWALNFRVSIIV